MMAKDQPNKHFHINNAHIINNLPTHSFPQIQLIDKQTNFRNHFESIVQLFYVLICYVFLFYIDWFIWRR